VDGRSGLNKRQLTHPARRVSSVVAALIVLTGVGCAAALATVPGKNGRIAFRRYFNSDHTKGAIFTINADGSGERRVTHPPAEACVCRASRARHCHDCHAGPESPANGGLRSLSASRLHTVTMTREPLDSKGAAPFR
jgi:hypothetical protein